MDSGIAIHGIRLVASGLEIVGVAVIAISFVHAIIRGLVHFGQRKPDAYEKLRNYMGKALQLGLEFLVAADIIRTVTDGATVIGLLTLGLLILVRTFLSWSITMETEGCWPWQIASKEEKEESRARYLAKSA